ncbi:hypothetical protein F4X10_21300 [Candidatus Poribacteria bacterium]|nr:hypothetical protein [Candidatus Poribacteria bacterium]
MPVRPFTLDDPRVSEAQLPSGATQFHLTTGGFLLADYDENSGEDFLDGNQFLGGAGVIQLPGQIVAQTQTGESIQRAQPGPFSYLIRNWRVRIALNKYYLNSDNPPSGSEVFDYAFLDILVADPNSYSKIYLALEEDSNDREDAVDPGESKAIAFAGTPVLQCIPLVSEGILFNELPNFEFNAGPGRRPVYYNQLTAEFANDVGSYPNNVKIYLGSQLPKSLTRKYTVTNTVYTAAGVRNQNLTFQDLVNVKRGNLYIPRGQFIVYATVPPLLVQAGQQEPSNLLENIFGIMFEMDGVYAADPENLLPYFSL